MAKRFMFVSIGVLVAGAVLGSALGAVRWRIHRSCREHIAVAQRAHPHSGDDVAALSDFMNSDSHSIRERNLAVWTLGRLGDPVALLVLESAYTGGLCDHDEHLC